MEFLKHVINILAYPYWSFSLTLLLFYFMLRSKGLWTKKGGIALGLIGVRAVTPGAPGSFIIEANAEANQAVVAADTSPVVWFVIG